MFLFSLMVSAQVSGEFLYARERLSGRVLRVLARLVLLPATLALFLASLSNGQRY